MPTAGLPTPGPHAAQRSLGVRQVVWAGTGACLLLLALLLAIVSYQRHAQLQTQLSRAALLARVLEDHATRSIETAALSLSALADEVVATRRIESKSGENNRSEGSLEWVLNQTLAGLPVLRAVAVLDAQGRVLASTEAGLQGQVVDLQRLGPLPPQGREALGAFVAGRGLLSLVRQGPARVGDLPAVPSGVGFIPLVRQLQPGQGAPLWLVGLINPDAIANYQQQVLADERASALLLSLDGQVLAATTSAAMQPGQRMPDLPVFRQYLPAVEFGSYVGTGTQPGPQVLAFRAARRQPLVVVVETAQADALQDWRREALTLAAVTLLVVAALAWLTALAARSLQARETARRQRDQAQAEVAQRERELSIIATSVQELLFRTDAQGRLVFVNTRWRSVSGLDTAPLLGRTLAQLVQPASAAAATALFAPPAAGHAGPAEQKGRRAALVRLGAAGVEHDFEVAVTPLHEGEQLLGYAGSAVDVTAQRQAQARLGAQLAFTELLLDVLPLPLATLDGERRYVTVNKAWTDFTGRSRAEVIGQPQRTLHWALDPQLHDTHDQELLAQGGQVRYEARALHRDGSQRDLAITKAAVPGNDGTPAGILVAFMDVTEFREAERATREARDAAEDASRTKTEFIANISHELRTPLQSILGFSELGRTRGADQPRLGAMFGDIHAAGQRMLALVNDLLDVAKLESTVGSFEWHRQDVRPLVHAVAAELAPQRAARSLHLEMRLSDSPLTARVDAARLQQVVRNVLANAIRFSPAGSTLLVEGHIDPDTRLRVSVVDQGPGIPEAELESIFEAFVQSSATKDGAGGTGLGLAISRKIMQAHGGEIVATNNPGGGASVHIYLPTRSFGEAPALA